jgi:hypothetical protein
MIFHPQGYPIDRQFRPAVRIVRTPKGILVRVGGGTFQWQVTGFTQIEWKRVGHSKLTGELIWLRNANVLLIR